MIRRPPRSTLFPTRRSSDLNPAPGGGTSNPQTFSIGITNTNPVPTTTGLSPTAAVAGGPGFTLTVTGTNFIGGTGDPKTTRLNSSHDQISNAVFCLKKKQQR